MAPLSTSGASVAAEATNMSSVAPTTTTASEKVARDKRKAKRRQENAQERERAAEKLLPARSKLKKGKELPVTDFEMLERSAKTDLVIGGPHRGKGSVILQFNNDPEKDMGFEAKGDEGLEELHQQVKTCSSEELMSFCFTKFPEVFTVTGELQTRLQHNSLEVEQAQLKSLSLMRQYDNARRELVKMVTERDEARHEVAELTSDRDRKAAELSKVTVEKDRLMTELETLKNQQINQGVLGEALVKKLLETKGFASFASDLYKETMKIGQADILNRLGRVYPHLGLRKKKMGWHSDAVEVARRYYVRKVKEELPKFALLEHLKTQEPPLTLEQVQSLSVDYDNQLDSPFEPLGDFEDLDKDPSEVH